MTQLNGINMFFILWAIPRFWFRRTEMNCIEKVVRINGKSKLGYAIMDVVHNLSLMLPKAFC